VGCKCDTPFNGIPEVSQLKRTKAETLIHREGEPSEDLNEGEERELAIEIKKEQRRAKKSKEEQERRF
jgi:hypothetical protein